MFIMFIIHVFGQLLALFGINYFEPKDRCHRQELVCHLPVR